MTRKWVVLFEGKKPGPADDFTVEFVDIREILGGIPTYKPLLFEKLTENIKEQENYYPWENIKNVIPPEEVPFGLSSYFILLAIDKNNLKFGLFMILLEDQVVLGGIWPQEFAEAIKEDNEILDGVLYALLEKPDNWKEVFLVYAPQQDS